jgi:hypothetical protein
MDDEEQEVYVIPTRKGEYEETVCAIVPLEEGLAILTSSQDEEE